ncbi:unnamed protein product [Rhizoctonia solani]|uniref:Chalcone isomerase domain-containing protein n=1 Tax=Rhizoctonia solani TaxID=456999 RepID=A0A8H3DM04_9AGAM|nr:unnamed protein product [Rhizoctonia solani]
MNIQTQLSRLIRLNESAQLLLRCCFATSNNQIPRPMATSGHPPEPPVRFAIPMKYTRRTLPPKWNFRIKNINWKVLGGIGLTGLVFHMWQSEPSLDEQFVPIDTEILDRATLISFPTRLKLDGEPKMTLLGVGVRTVSFLGVRVYSVGFYADLSKVNTKAFRRCQSPEDCIHLLIQTTSCALRIVPTQSISYSHLRDGFISAIHARQIRARKNGSLTTEREEAS